MERPYTVALHGGEALPAPQRIAAEVGFIVAIESALGGPHRVAESYRAYLTVHAADATAELARRWSQACESATREAIDSQHIGADASFEVKLAGVAGQP